SFEDDPTGFFPADRSSVFWLPPHKGGREKNRTVHQTCLSRRNRLGFGRCLVVLLDGKNAVSPWLRVRVDDKWTSSKRGSTCASLIGGRVRGPLPAVQPGGLGACLCALDECGHGARHHAGGVPATLATMGDGREDPESAGLADPRGPQPGGRSCQERLPPQRHAP